MLLTSCIKILAARSHEHVAAPEHCINMMHKRPWMWCGYDKLSFATWQHNAFIYFYAYALPMNISAKASMHPINKIKQNNP